MEEYLKKIVKIVLSINAGIISIFVVIIDFIFLFKKINLLWENNFILILSNTYALLCAGINFCIINKVLNIK